MAKPGSVGERLRMLREERKLKVREVAAALGTSVGTIGDLESGKARNPRGDTLLALSNFYKVTPTWLQTGEGDKEMFAKTPAEEELLAEFRRLTPARREELLDIAALMRKRDGKENPHMDDSPARTAPKH